MPRSSCRCAVRRRGLAVACGINPRYGRLDPYAMAGLRDRRGDAQLRRRGRRPRPHRPARQLLLGQHRAPRDPRLARAGGREACHDLALAYGTPFISGKDSLYNEYTHEGQSLAIPPTLLISAIGQVPDVRRCVNDGPRSTPNEASSDLDLASGVRRSVRR